MLLEPDDIMRCRDFVSFYVADLKFGNESCAETLTSRPAGSHQRQRPEAGYVEIVTAAIKTAASQPEHQVIIRHLPIPGHLECCTMPVLEWVAHELPEAPVHLMLGYYPNGRSGIPEIERTLTRDEAARSLDAARRLSLNLVPSALSARAGDTGQPTWTGGIMPVSPTSIVIRRDGDVLIPDLPAELQFIVEELQTPGPARRTRGLVNGRRALRRRQLLAVSNSGLIAQDVYTRGAGR